MFWATSWSWVRDTVGDHDNDQSSAVVRSIGLVISNNFGHGRPTSAEVASLVISLQPAQSLGKLSVVQVLVKLHIVLGLFGVSHNGESSLSAKWSSRIVDGLGHVSHSVEHFHPGVSYAGGGVEEDKVVDVAWVLGLDFAVAVAVAVVGSLHFGDGLWACPFGLGRRPGN